MAGYFGAGVAQGLAAGLTPGPLTALILAEAVRHGARAAAVVALAPLLTDTPIVLLALLATAALPPALLPPVAIIGGLYVGWLGLGTVRAAWTPTTATSAPGEPPASARGTFASLRAGVLTNVLNPHPYLFWTLVGVPALAAALRLAGPSAVAALLAGFFGAMIGTKMLLGTATAHGARLLGGAGHRLLLAASGVTLIGFGALLAAQGLRAV